MRGLPALGDLTAGTRVQSSFTRSLSLKESEGARGGKPSEKCRSLCSRWVLSLGSRSTLCVQSPVGWGEQLWGGDLAGL